MNCAALDAIELIAVTKGIIANLAAPRLLAVEHGAQVPFQSASDQMSHYLGLHGHRFADKQAPWTRGK